MSCAFHTQPSASTVEPSATRVTERSGSRRHSAQIFSSSLSSMPPAKKRPRRSHLPSFRRVRECSVSTSDTVSSLPLWKSKKWKPSSSASTAPPFLRNASAPTSRLIDQFSILPVLGSRRQIEGLLTRQALDLAPRSQNRQDRKSTRLNSS